MPSVSVPPPSKGPVESGPKCGDGGVPPLLCLSTLTVSVSEDLSNPGVEAARLGLGLGGDGGGNGLHDRTPSSLLKARATSALGQL